VKCKNSKNFVFNSFPCGRDRRETSYTSNIYYIISIVIHTWTTGLKKRINKNSPLFQAGR
jgi:hypothetical protein